VVRVPGATSKNLAAQDGLFTLVSGFGSRGKSYVSKQIRHLAVQEAVERINPIVRGWVNYFRRGNSARALGSVKFHVERKVRRFAAKQRGRRGFGWKR
jgi:hypothetical protein